MAMGWWWSEVTGGADGGGLGKKKKKVRDVISIFWDDFKYF